MAMTMHVDIVSAEAEIYSGPATMVFAPAVMGEVGILPRHAPLLTKIKPGEVKIRTPEGTEEYFYVSGGMLEVQAQTVTILADTAARAKDIVLRMGVHNSSVTQALRSLSGPPPPLSLVNVSRMYRVLAGTASGPSSCSE